MKRKKEKREERREKKTRREGSERGKREREEEKRGKCSKGRQSTLTQFIITQRATSKPAKMVRISVLNDALRNMVNAERKGKRQVRTQTPRHATPHPPIQKKKTKPKRKNTPSARRKRNTGEGRRTPTENALARRNKTEQHGSERLAESKKT